jgi:hypothetical protein
LAQLREAEVAVSDELMRAGAGDAAYFEGRLRVLEGGEVPKRPEFFDKLRVRALVLCVRLIANPRAICDKILGVSRDVNQLDFHWGN